MGPATNISPTFVLNKIVITLYNYSAVIIIRRSSQIEFATAMCHRIARYDDPTRVGLALAKFS